MEKTEQKLIKFIDENCLLKKGDSLLISLSGGPDSVFLLHFLNKFRQRFDINLGAFHLNHKIRGDAADKDEKFCGKISALYNIPFFSSSLNIKKIAAAQKISIEEAGRIARYDELTKIAADKGFTVIATAHNADDNAETVLLNLIKGAGLRGISGIPVKRNNIIRPVLILSKNEILLYLDKYKIKFRKDKTNQSDAYERNYIRKRIVPLIKKKLNPSFEKTILSSSGIFREHIHLVENRLSSELNSYYEPGVDTVKIKAAEILALTEVEQSEVLKLIIERNFSSNITFNDIARLLRVLYNEPGKVEVLSGNLQAARERDCIYVFRNRPDEDFKDIRLKTGDEISIDGNTLSIKAEIKIPEKFSNNRRLEYISADDLDEEFILRRWKKGDRFKPIGLKGSKKVSDFLNGLKINSIDKKKQLVLLNQGRIVWIIGLRIDDRFKIKNSTKRIYQLCLK